MNGKKKILIVEDEIITALELKGILERNGYEVAGSVMSGEEAIQESSAKRPHLIIMDIGLLGEIDGADAAAYILQRYKIPILFLTGNADKMTYDRAMELNPAGYIVKPFDETELVKIISGIVNS
jgi:DNA-binding NarL/FixJ family response regulator